MNSSKKDEDLMEKEFAAFFNKIKAANLSNHELRSLTVIITKARLLEKGKRWLSFLLPLIALVILWNCSDTFQWIVSAIGRLLLIQLLPYWNWTELDRKDCLIGFPLPLFSTDFTAQIYDQSRNDFSTGNNYENCILCQEIGKKPE